MTIKEYLAEKFPNVESVTVKITELCLDDSPPRTVTRSYDETSETVEEELGQLHHDKMSMRTAGFDRLKPILSTIHRNVDSHEGKLPPYHTSTGKVVSRSFECRITYKQDGSQIL